MTFVLPAAFFSIFALVFGQQSRRGPSAVRLAIVDEDRSDASRALVHALGREEALVKDGDAPVALVLPAGFGAGFLSFEAPARARLLADPSDPIAAPRRTTR